MISSSTSSDLFGGRTTPAIQTVLLVAFLIWTKDPAIAQQPNAQYVSERDFESKADADKHAKLIEKLDALRGKTFWYQPKPDAISKIEFLEPSKDGDVPAYPYENKFVVETETSFTVTGYEADKDDRYYLRLEFPDEKIGYLGVYILATMSPDEYPAIEHLYPGRGNANDFEEYIFSRPPQEIFAAEKKAAAERKAKQAKANAEWKARGGVTVGMTTIQVLNSNWGKPEKVNRTVTQNGTNEQWVYGGNNYLYFENGKLTAIQN